eukprot:jgi/Chlat1/631/Chrsp103S08591
MLAHDGDGAAAAAGKEEEDGVEGHEDAGGGGGGAPLTTAAMEWTFPVYRPLRRRLKPDHTLFAYGNIERELLAKQIALALTPEEEAQLLRDEDTASTSNTRHGYIGFMVCPMAGCKKPFRSTAAFEQHYDTQHRAACSVCRRVFPTQRILSIHMSERHDSYFAAMAARGMKVFECLVESCGKKFEDDEARCSHMVMKHNFPKGYRFSAPRRLSKKQRQKSGQTNKPKPMQFTQPTQSVSMDVDSLSNAMSKLSTVTAETAKLPDNISFGRRGRGGASSGLMMLPRKRM